MVRLETVTELVPSPAMVPTAWLALSFSVDPLTVKPDEASSWIASPACAPFVIATVKLPPAKLAGLSGSVTKPVASNPTGEELAT